MAAVELALHPANIVVNVKTPNGQPIEAASVLLIDESTGFSLEALTDAAGVAAFEDALAGTYKIEVLQEAEIVVQRLFRAQSSERYDLRLIAAVYRLNLPILEHAP